jgi:hypothetical protein
MVIGYTYYFSLVYIFLNTITQLYLDLFVLCMRKFKMPKVS